MLRNLVILIAVTVLISIGLGLLFERAYPFVLASETARTSIVVTPEQTLELKAAARASDMIAFAIFAAVACGAIAVCLGKHTNQNRRWMGLGIGVALGIVAGASAGWIGHWFEAHPDLDFEDPMIYSLVRWAVMLAPLGIAVGIASSDFGHWRSQLFHLIVGALIGIMAASVIYALLSGMATVLEGKTKIFPHFLSNRILIMATTVFCVGLGIITQAHGTKKGSSSLDEDDNPIRNGSLL
jgi:hypothetical protein